MKDVLFNMVLTIMEGAARKENDSISLPLLGREVNH